MVTLATLETEFKELDEKVQPIASAIKNAGADFDFATLDVDGGDADEKFANFQQLMNDRADAEVKYKNAKEAHESVKELKRFAPSDDSVKPNPSGPEPVKLESIEDYLKSFNSNPEAKSFEGNIPLDKFFSGQKAAFSLGNTDAARQDARVTERAFPSMALLNRFMRTSPTGGHLDIIDMTDGGNAANVARNNDAVAGEVTNTGTQRSLQIEGIVAGQGINKTLKGDNARLAVMLEMMLGSQVLDRLATQVMQGTGTSPQLHGANTQITRTSAVPASTKVLPYLEGKVVTAWANGVMYDTILMNIATWQELRAAWEAIHFPLMGMYDGIGFGTVMGAVVIPTTYLAANTAILGDFGRFAELAIREDVNVQVFEQTLANQYADYIRAAVEAAVGYWQRGTGATDAKARFDRLTATNNLTSDGSGTQ